MKKKTVKKQKKAVKPTRKKLTLLDRLPKDDGERLELMIRMTEKHIDPRGVDKTMENQAARLRAELAEWRKANR